MSQHGTASCSEAAYCSEAAACSGLETPFLLMDNTRAPRGRTTHARVCCFCCVPAAVLPLLQGRLGAALRYLEMVPGEASTSVAVLKDRIYRWVCVCVVECSRQLSQKAHQRSADVLSD